jgi:hypothetical protein
MSYKKKYLQKNDKQGKVETETVGKPYPNC